MTKVEKIIKEITILRTVYREIEDSWKLKCPSDLKSFTQKILKKLKKYAPPGTDISWTSEIDLEEYLEILQTWIEKTTLALEQGPLKQEKEKLEQLLQKIEHCEDYYLPLV